jgi:hypothetical protein
MEEIQGAAIFLASGSASFVTSEIIAVDGGSLTPRESGTASCFESGGIAGSKFNGFELVAWTSQQPVRIWNLWIK